MIKLEIQSSRRLGHDKVEAEWKTTPSRSRVAAKQSEDVSVMYLFNAQFSNSQSCCSSVGAEQFGTFCTGFVKSV